MAHSNISIFVPHVGCPNMCSFCNQKSISGTQQSPTAEYVNRICLQAMQEVKDKEDCEIAFFGGSFTAIERNYMEELLRAASKYIFQGGFKGIRISTRPDFIDKDVLTVLKHYGVTAIELGAQSMSDNVLNANNRGHTSEDVYKACRLIREFGFELGLQMMIGLYKSEPENEFAAMQSIVKIKPDTVRIYPVVVLKGTQLAELYEKGIYKLYTFDKAVNICSLLLETFESEGIKIIRCGLHASDNIEEDMIAGFYHPAFKEICESRIYRRLMTEQISKTKISSEDTNKNLKEYKFAVNDKCISKALGQKRSNAEYFKKLDINISIIGNSNLKKYQCMLVE